MATLACRAHKKIYDINVLFIPNVLRKHGTSQHLTHQKAAKPTTKKRTLVKAHLYAHTTTTHTHNNTHLMNRPKTQHAMLRSWGVSAFCCCMRKSNSNGRCGPSPSRQPSDAAPSDSIALSRCHTSVLASRSCRLG